MKTALLVFFTAGEEQRFDPKAWLGKSDETGVINIDSESFMNKGQGITRLRWLVPTENYEVVRHKIKDKVVNDMSDRMAYGLSISEGGQRRLKVRISEKASICDRSYLYY